MQCCWVRLRLPACQEGPHWTSFQGHCGTRLRLFAFKEGVSFTMRGCELMKVERALCMCQWLSVHIRVHVVCMCECTYTCVWCVHVSRQCTCVWCVRWLRSIWFSLSINTTLSSLYPECKCVMIKTSIINFLYHHCHNYVMSLKLNIILFINCHCTIIVWFMKRTLLCKLLNLVQAPPSRLLYKNQKKLKNWLVMVTWSRDHRETKLFKFSS